MEACSLRAYGQSRGRPCAGELNIQARIGDGTTGPGKVISERSAAGSGVGKRRWELHRAMGKIASGTEFHCGGTVARTPAKNRSERAAGGAHQFTGDADGGLV